MPRPKNMTDAQAAGLQKAADFYSGKGVRGGERAQAAAGARRIAKTRRDLGLDPKTSSSSGNIKLAPSKITRANNGSISLLPSKKTSNKSGTTNGKPTKASDMFKTAGTAIRNNASRSRSNKNR